MIMKEFGPRGGGARPWHPPLDPPMVSVKRKVHFGHNVQPYLIFILRIVNLGRPAVLNFDLKNCEPRKMKPKNNDQIRIIKTVCFFFYFGRILFLFS